MMKHRIVVGLLATLVLFAPAWAEAPFNEDKVIAAIKVLMYRAPCCGFCARLDPAQARNILTYLEGQKQPEGEMLWRNLGDKILVELDKIDPAEGRRVRRQAKKVMEANHEKSARS